ncbi:MAG: class I tRNA ligase family protein [bacterium]|nr:class I tRNA ligase family protein [bacterium]
MKKDIKAQKINEYDHLKIEKKWQKKWSALKLYKTKEEKNKNKKTDDFTSESEAKKFYILDMFPYPSGEGLHVGHPKGYIATDIYSRFKRMQGYNVLHPMGFDAFGLPAENYAIKMKMNPADMTAKNVKRYKEQLEILGFDYDWSREVNTTDPKYYKWTQWIFLQLFKKGLAYESYEPINWCPSCKTGLANEDVEDGKCERCGTVVEKKPMRQWVLKITDYAEKLLAGIDEKDANGKPLLDWPDSIKELQRNWIGKSEGAEIDFKVKIADKISDKIPNGKNIKVFTTRPDTIFGVTYVVLAPESPLVSEFINSALNKSEIEKYISEAKKKTEIDRTDAKKEKTGVEIKGIKAINPANNEEIPVYVADYVLAEYGTGAVMAVPAHDERDWQFAKKYNLPVKDVIAPYFFDNTENSRPREGLETVNRRVAVGILKHWSEDKYIMLDWKNGWTGFITGGVEENESIDEGIKREIIEETGYKNVKIIKRIGGVTINHFYAPHKEKNQFIETHCVYLELVNDDRLPVSEEEIKKHSVLWKNKEEVLPFLKKGSPMGDSRYSEFFWEHLNTDNYSYVGSGNLINSGNFNGRNSNEVMKEITKSIGGEWVNKYKLREWVFSRQRYWGEPIPLIHCEKCGVTAVPDKDLPVKLPKVKFYEPTGTGESPLAGIAKWVNVKCPECKGKAKRETNTMPQWAGSSWYYLRYMDPKNSKVFVDPKIEKFWSPVDLYVGGAEHATRHLIYARFWHRFLYDNGFVSTPEPFRKLQHVGLIMAEDGRKMSKRWSNVVNPDDIVKTYGADTMRLYEMFMGPFDQSIAWNTSSMVGTRRFLERVWRASEKVEKVNSKKNNIKNEFDKKNFEKEKDLPPYIHKAIKKVGEDISDMKYNTAVSTLMIALNEIEKSLEKSGQISSLEFSVFLKLLAPFAPHMSEELWMNLGNKNSIHLESWPVCDESKLIEKNVKIIVQINGKVRWSLEVDSALSKEKIETLIMENEIVKKWISGKKIIKQIFIPGKLLSIVTD